MLRIGLMLCGCGVLDGTDPLTAIALRMAASRAGDLVFAIAPDRPQADVIGLTTPLLDHQRNALAESTRLSAGRIDSLELVRDDELDVIAVPGGLGVSKTLCADEPVLGTQLALGVLARGGGWLVFDEGAAWAARAAASRGITGWSLAAGADAHVRDPIEATGHRAAPELGTWIEESSHAVFSIALGGDPAPHLVLDHCTRGLELLRTRLAREDGASA